LAQLFYQATSANNITSTITATAAGQAVTFTEVTSAGDGTFDAPTPVSATFNGATEIDLTWVNHASTATGILIEQSTDGVTWTTTATLGDPTTTTYPATGLTAGQTYYFRVTGTK